MGCFYGVYQPATNILWGLAMMPTNNIAMEHHYFYR